MAGLIAESPCVVVHLLLHKMDVIARERSDRGNLVIEGTIQLKARLLRAEALLNRHGDDVAMTKKAGLPRLPIGRLAMTIGKKGHSFYSGLSYLVGDGA